MHTGKGTVVETYFDGMAAARIACQESLIPSPGQYILAETDPGDTATLPVPLFRAGSINEGFYAAAPIPKSWTPGTPLNLRGPLGRGYSLPPASRAVGLAAFGDTIHRLAALIEPAINQGAGVALLTNQPPQGLPSELEIMPIDSLHEVIHWADYMAFDMPREMLPVFLEKLPATGIQAGAQMLLTTPMPCGGRGDCGVCSVSFKRGYQLICKDGPVFDVKPFL